MTIRQDLLRQKLCEIITNPQNPYDSDEQKLRHLAINFKMILPDFEPSNTIDLNKRQTDFFKNVARFMVAEEGWSNPTDLINGFLSEFAFHLALNFNFKRHKWAGIYFGSAKEASLDFTVWRKGKRLTIGVRSSPHLNFLRYFNKPIVFYPADRLENARTKIASYIVPASVFDKDDGSTVVAFWGAISHRKLINVMNTLRTSIQERGEYLQETKDVPLSEFSPDLLNHLYSSLDST